MLWGGRNIVNKSHWRVWGVLVVSGPHWVCHPLTACVLSQSTLLGLQVALHVNCLKQALGCMHFPGLSRSGSDSRVLLKGTGSVGPAFCALPSPSSSGDRVLGEHTLPKWRVRLINSLAPAAPFAGWQRLCILWCDVCLLGS